MQLPTQCSYSMKLIKLFFICACSPDDDDHYLIKTYGDFKK
jgi:hypothetical protein